TYEGANEFTLVFLSVELGGPRPGAVATWSRLSSGGTVWSVDRNAVRSSSFEARRSHRSYAEFAVSRSCV
ncbi:MAG: hypothetical protein ACRD1T_11100, partial [Acidimicrobiia bacterium]